MDATTRTDDLELRLCPPEQTSSWVAQRGMWPNVGSERSVKRQPVVGDGQVRSAGTITNRILCLVSMPTNDSRRRRRIDRHKDEKLQT